MAPVIDSHVHVWPRWPHQPAVPDPGTRASVEHLVFEMDANGVDDGLRRILPAGDLPNLKVKVTGFFYGTDRPWEYPLPKAVEVVHRFYDSWAGNNSHSLLVHPRRGDGHGPRRESGRVASRRARSPRLRRWLRAAGQAQRAPQ